MVAADGLTPRAVPFPTSVISPEIQLTAYDPAEWRALGNGQFQNINTLETTFSLPSMGRLDLMANIPAGCIAGDPNACNVGAIIPPLNNAPGSDDNAIAFMASVLRNLQLHQAILEMLGRDGGIEYMTFVLKVLQFGYPILQVSDSIQVQLMTAVNAILNQFDQTGALSNMVGPTLWSVTGMPSTVIANLMDGVYRLLMLPFNIGVGAADATLVGDSAGATTIDLADADISALSADGSFVPGLFNDSLGDAPDGAISDLVGALADIAPVL